MYEYLKVTKTSTGIIESHTNRDSLPHGTPKHYFLQVEVDEDGSCVLPEIPYNKHDRLTFTLDTPLTENEIKARGVVKELTDGEMGHTLDKEIAIELSKTDKKNQIKLSCYYLLLKTDWMIIRHKEEIDTSTGTTITTKQYTDLLTKRKDIRSKSGAFESEVEVLTSCGIIDAYPFDFGYNVCSSTGLYIYTSTGTY
jgi:hypothetical protein